jgi:hypothetical protein
MKNVAIQTEYIKNNTLSFVETQQFINNLVGGYIQSNVNDISFEHGCDANHTHINLDVSEVAIEHDDVVSARIYPDHITTFDRFAYTVEPILVDSEKLKKNLETFLKKIHHFSVLGIEISIKYAILLDTYCEELLLRSVQYIRRISDTVSNKLDLVKSNHAKHTVEQQELRLEKSKVHNVQITSYTNSHHFEIVPVRYKKKNTIREVKLQKDIQHRQKSIFSRVCVLLYTELRYGGVLQNIDSI